MHNNILLSVTLLLTISNAIASPIQNPKTRWKFQTQGAIRGGPVVDLSKIYFGSSDGFVYALDKRSGDIQWKYQTNGPITGAPSLANNLVIVSSRDNHVYALDPRNGNLVWKFEMQALLPYDWGWEYFTASPVIEKDKVLIASGDGHLYALGIRGGKLLWKFKTNARLRATPLVSNGKAYQPGFDGNIYVVSSTDGKLLKTLRTEGSTLDSKQFFFDRNSIYTKPAIQDSLLVMGSRDGHAYCFNINSGMEKWRFSYGPTWAMSTAVYQNIAYVGWSDNNTFCAIELLTGKEKWKFKAGSLVYSTPQITNDEIFIGSADHKIYCLDKSSGNKKWEYETGGAVFSSPILDNNILYSGSDDGALYALEEGIRPNKAIYSTDSKLANYFKEHGFVQLDSGMLLKFLTERIADKNPSVIVFRGFMLPNNVIGSQPEDGLVRMYLEAGGKMVWLAEIPNFVKFGKGKPVGFDLVPASNMLGVKFERPFESGTYYSHATQIGMNWGLPPWLMTTFASVNPEGIIPLALDEYARPSIWLKKLNPRPGSGFISGRLWGANEIIGEKHLSILLQLALHELE